MIAVQTKPIETVALQVIGKSFRDAEAIIKDAGFISRVVVVHGAGLPYGNDSNARRIKLSLENEIVVRTWVG